MAAAAERAEDHGEEDEEVEEASGDTDDPLGYERAFRGVFEGMEGMEGLVRFSRYPNVTVYPLAVYRRVPVVQPET